MSTFHMIQEMNLRYHSLKMNDFLVLFTLAKILFMQSRNLAVKSSKQKSEIFVIFVIPQLWKGFQLFSLTE